MDEAWRFYDLIGAICASPPDRERTTLHSDRIFDRVAKLQGTALPTPISAAGRLPQRRGSPFVTCKVVHDAADRLSVISLQRGASFSPRTLLLRRTLTNSGQPLSSIAYASGYHDYTFFARAYRRRFSCVRAQQQRVRSDRREPPVRPHTGLCALCAHDSPNCSPGFDPS